MFIVGKSFFSEMLSKFNIKTVAPLCIISQNILFKDLYRFPYIDTYVYIQMLREII